jgi:hypothetical protein
MKFSRFLRFLAVISVPCTFHLLSIEDAQAFVEFFQSGFPKATVQGLKWTTDSSVSAAYTRDYIRPSSTKWNGITSKVNVAEGTTASYNVKYYISSSPTRSEKGLTVPYCKDSTGDNCAEQINGGNSPVPVVWTSARIYLYEPNMAADGYDQAKRIIAATHELGHALSLKHNPPLTVAPASDPAIMAAKIGPYSILSDLDKNNLKNKWGQ